MTETRPPHDYARSRAVLIGTWDYARLPAVPAARNSLERFSGLLTGPLCGWPTRQVQVLRNVPQRDNLPDRLMEWFGEATDVALFYFVGHGQLHEDELCLALGSSPQSGPRRTTVGLPFSDVRKALRECDARTKIVILDCCFAGQAADSRHSLADGSAEVIDKTLGTGAFTMAASGAYRTAWFEADGHTPAPQTYFTKYLVDVIEQGLPGHPEGLPLGAVFTATAEALAHDRRPEPTRSVRHHADHFVIARNVHEPAAVPSGPPPPSPPPPARPSAPDSAARPEAATGRDHSATGRRRSATVAAIVASCAAVVAVTITAAVLASAHGHDQKGPGEAGESATRSPTVSDSPYSPSPSPSDSPTPAPTRPTPTPTPDPTPKPTPAPASVRLVDPCQLQLSQATVTDFDLRMPGTDSNYNTNVHKECVWGNGGVDIFGIGFTTNRYTAGPISTTVEGPTTSSARINSAGICVISWPTSYGSAFVYAGVGPGEEEHQCDGSQAWANSVYSSLPDA
ncbi:caspase family protein [Streptomyces sp. NPDC048106]|uniref:caspase family protein n=1 Tax=Streptomyces sp. NPDC048106 TaxID=3155750 RepID=UPI00345631AF